MSLCVAAGGTALLRIAATAFTLAWTHSVERVRWEEDWAVAPGGLTLVEARVRGSAAGMEPAPEARLSEGWWRWRPGRGPQAELVLAASGATPDGWTLCAAGTCREPGRFPGEPVRDYACD